MKKLPKLSDTLFQKFEKDQLSNLSALTGGTATTTYDKNTHTANDCLTDDTKHATCDGVSCDLNKEPCA
jgi:hypothetical protein